MTVIQSTVSRAKPGRRHDVIAMALEASKLFERHGSGESRLLTAGVAGEATGTYVFTTEFANAQAWGACSDALNQDPETEALLDRIYADESPLVMESMSLGVEIPLDRPASKGRGRVVEAHVTRPLPGRFDAALELANVGFDFLEAHGAVGCRLIQLNDAGQLTDCHVVSWEFESMRAAGATADAYFTDPSAEPIRQLLTGSAAPMTTISGGMYTDIPM